MNRLGEILVTREAVSADGLRSALEACRRHGGRLGTWLVRLGLVNESTLLSALSEQTHCPSVGTLDLASAPTEWRAMLPSPYARRHLVVAFGRQGRTLDVAMVNPNDLVLLDEIASMTGLVIRPHVATEAGVAAALAIPLAATAAEASPPPPGPPRGTVKEWRQFWRYESTPPELMQALDAQPAPAPAMAASLFPSLEPVDGARLHKAAATLEDLADALATINHRDQVATLVLDFAATMADRVALFSVHQGKVMGWASSAPGVVEEDFHTLILPLDRPSLFLNLWRGADIHVGPLTGGEGNELLLDAFGPPRPPAAIIVPLRVRGKTAAFLWLDRGTDGIADVPLTTVRELARLGGLALEVLVIRQKLKVQTRLTGEGAGD